ncbi:hypothetical protein RFF05_12560 [Bengtsoniella intestinalis]|uniref:hypothetical protein n=1 Tax=Bengtsoniella intestinalis TaxID=3073143 RepID=UPI00391F9467
MGNLFEVPSVGYGILALLVSSVGTKQLQAVAPDFCPAVAIPQADQVTVNIFDTLTDAVVQRYHWKAGKTKIYRDPRLDCKGNGNFFITDYTYVQLKSKRSNPYCLPIPYTNGVVTVVGATTKQMTEIAPLVHAGTTFLLGCAKGEWDGIRYTAQDVGRYDPAVLQGLAEATAPTAQLLHLWRKELLKDERFAHRVVSKAKGSFGTSDSQFVSVRIDPKVLTLAIACQMFLEFLNFLVNMDAASPEVIALHRQGIQDAFYPQPKAEVRLETPLEPTIFVAI